MNNIKINQHGKIIRGEKKGWFIFIEDDRENTGGYLILISPSKSKKSNIGFDAWVLNYNDLEQYFVESKWEIEWQ